MSFDVICFFTEKFMNFVINWIELLKFEGLTSKSDTIHTNIQINGPKLVYTQEYSWATAKKI